jgi:hypothetical protein
LASIVTLLSSTPSKSVMIPFTSVNVSDMMMILLI